MDVEAEAAAFIDLEKGVVSAEEALAGARDIIAEWVSEDQRARKDAELFLVKGIMRSKVISGKEEEGIKYKDYYEWEEPVAKAPSHRILAIAGGKARILILRILPPEDEALKLLESLFLKGTGPASEQVRAAVHDSYKRLLSASMETEIRLATKKQADEKAIRVFVENLRQLLLSPPLGGKNVLAIDPGYRTAAKWYVLTTGNCSITILSIPSSQKRAWRGCRKDQGYLRTFQDRGNSYRKRHRWKGDRIIHKRTGPSGGDQRCMVNESGASIYSASDVARKNSLIMM